MELVVYSQYYRTRTPERQREIDQCLWRNLNHPSISRMVLFYESNAPPLPQGKVPVEVVNSDERITYAEWFRWVKRQGSGVDLLLSADICLDNVIGQLSYQSFYGERAGPEPTESLKIANRIHLCNRTTHPYGYQSHVYSSLVVDELAEIRCISQALSIQDPAQVHINERDIELRAHKMCHGTARLEQLTKDWQQFISQRWMHEAINSADEKRKLHPSSRRETVHLKQPCRLGQPYQPTRRNTSEIRKMILDATLHSIEATGEPENKA